MVNKTEIMLGFDDIMSALVSGDPDSSVIVRGQPGIGKTSMAPLVAQQRTERTGITHKVLTLDCTCMDVGDVVIPDIQEMRGIRQVVYTPNAAFGINAEHPVVILLDEFGKAPKPVQDALLPVILEHRVGAYFLPKGSQVIATTNLATDSVGDLIQAHAYNRVTTLTMRNPTHDEWNKWAIESGANAIVIAAAQQFPMFFQMYMDDDAKSNPYIFDPVHHPERVHFVTPRSLVKAGGWLDRRASLSSTVLLAVLSGSIGEAAARDVLTLVTLSDTLPNPNEVLKDPKNAKVPAEGVAQLLLGLNVIRLVTQGDTETADKIIEFVLRLRPEVQATLVITMIGSLGEHFMRASKLKDLAVIRAKYSQAA